MKPIIFAVAVTARTRLYETYTRVAVLKQTQVNNPLWNQDRPQPTRALGLEELTGEESTFDPKRHEPQLLVLDREERTDLGSGHKPAAVAHENARRVYIKSTYILLLSRVCAGVRFRVMVTFEEDGRDVEVTKSHTSLSLTSTTAAQRSLNTAEALVSRLWRRTTCDFCEFRTKRAALPQLLRVRQCIRRVRLWTRERIYLLLDATYSDDELASFVLDFSPTCQFDDAASTRGLKDEGGTVRNRATPLVPLPETRPRLALLPCSTARFLRAIARRRFCTHARYSEHAAQENPAAHPCHLRQLWLGSFCVVGLFRQPLSPQAPTKAASLLTALMHDAATQVQCGTAPGSAASQQSPSAAKCKGSRLPGNSAVDAEEHHAQVAEHTFPFSSSSLPSLRRKLIDPVPRSNAASIATLCAHLRHLCNRPHRRARCDLEPARVFPPGTAAAGGHAVWIGRAATTSAHPLVSPFQNADSAAGKRPYSILSVLIIFRIVLSMAVHYLQDELQGELSVWRPDTLRVSYCVGHPRYGAVSGLLTRPVSVDLTLSRPRVGAPDTAPDTSSGRSRVSHKDFVPGTGNVGTADPASDMIRVRLKVSATYFPSVRFNSGGYDSISDTQSVRYVSGSTDTSHSAV
ncbi:hypothetical protein K438DRAFT_1981221 [Mycena galopus ATCC 62051]|nr:hypothetical protein K438DRAFT_1981221 [Mycena galopus ATCC 62051]